MKINWYKEVKVKGNWVKTNREVGGDNELVSNRGRETNSWSQNG